MGKNVGDNMEPKVSQVVIDPLAEQVTHAK